MSYAAEDDAVRQALEAEFSPRQLLCWELGRRIYEQAASGQASPEDENDEHFQSWQLGTLIYAQNPYGEGLRVVGPLQVAEPEPNETLEHFIERQQGRETVEVDGLGWKFDEHQGFTNPKVSAFDKIMQGLFWYFRGQPNRLAKALRLKYTYDNQPSDVETFLLIGYHGQGGE